MAMQDAELQNILNMLSILMVNAVNKAKIYKVAQILT